MTGRPGRWGRRAASVIVAAALGSGIAAAEARADERSESGAGAPRLEVTGCPSSWGPELGRAIAVEIGAPAFDDEAAGTLGSPQDSESPHTLSVRCRLDRVVVVARGRATGESLDRTLGLEDLPPATAPRVIALAGVELLAALDPAFRRRLAAREAEAAARAPRPAPGTTDDRRLALVAAGVYRAFLAPAGLRAWGGALQGRRASAGGGWSLGLGLEVVGGERSASLGLTSALLASARASVGARGRFAAGRLALSFDLGGRVGVARLVGRSGEGDVVASSAVRPWAGPVAILAAHGGVGWFCTELSAEVGWAAVSATGLVNEGPALAASGPWIALSLGIGIGPP